MDQREKFLAVQEEVRNGVRVNFACAKHKLPRATYYWYIKKAGEFDSSAAPSIHKEQSKDTPGAGN